jgi:hypothetical protein
MLFARFFKLKLRFKLCHGSSTIADWASLACQAENQDRNAAEYIAHMESAELSLE